jgi:hypothetical protein
MRYPPKVIVMEYNYYLLKSLYDKPPVEWLASMFKKGYREIIDMATNKAMTTEAEVRDYFAEDTFLRNVASSHTDLILKFKGVASAAESEKVEDAKRRVSKVEAEVPKRKNVKPDVSEALVANDAPARPRKKMAKVE